MIQNLKDNKKLNGVRRGRGCHKLLKLNLYKDNYEWRLDSKDSFAELSYVGCIFTVLLAVSLGIFAFYRVSLAAQRNGW